MKTQSIVTPLGCIEASWTDLGLYSLKLTASRPEPGGNRSDISDAMPARQRGLREALGSYFESGHLIWSLADLDWSGITDFQRRVLEACVKIEVGETSTYSELAHQAGSPKAARAVGGVMAGNRWPVVIPCHRVVGASGKLTGYSALGGLETKQTLLDFEKSKSGKAEVCQKFLF